MTDWGIPDWRDARAYGDTSEWSENRWRWEFTRRREDYRADFDRYAADFYAVAIDLHGKYFPLDKILKPTDPGFIATERWPPKYGLPGLPNPRISDQPSHVICFQRFPGFTFVAGDNGVTVEDTEGTVSIQFDLKLPIKPQLEGLQSRLEVEQQLMVEQQLIRDEDIKPRRKHPRTWLRYLRVIDGREAGASLSKLAEIAVVETEDTVPTPQGAKVVWDAARALMFNWPA